MISFSEFTRSSSGGPDRGYGQSAPGCWVGLPTRTLYRAALSSNSITTKLSTRFYLTSPSLPPPSFISPPITTTTQPSTQPYQPPCPPFAFIHKQFRVYQPCLPNVMRASTRTPSPMCGPSPPQRPQYPLSPHHRARRRPHHSLTRRSRRQHTPPLTLRSHHFRHHPIPASIHHHLFPRRTRSRTSPRHLLPPVSTSILC